MRELPDYIMEEVKLVLCYEAVAYVIRWNGRLRIVAELHGYLHAGDESVVATFRQEDVFTEDERTENYINANHKYPPWYKGRRDESVFARMLADTVFDARTGELRVPGGRMVDGEFVYSGQKGQPEMT